VYPAAFLSFFLMLFCVLAFGSISQADSIDGLQNLQEPRWESMIHGAWLYVNDKREWMKQLLAVSSGVGLVFGALTGFSVCLMVRNQPASWISFLLGILLTLSLARAYFEYWDKQDETSMDTTKEALESQT